MRAALATCARMAAFWLLIATLNACTNYPAWATLDKFTIIACILAFLWQVANILEK
jgi:hypothetical protein